MSSTQAWTATARAHGPRTLIGARVLLGAGVGASSVAVPVYVAETAPVASTRVTCLVVPSACLSHASGESPGGSLNDAQQNIQPPLTCMTI